MLVRVFLGTGGKVGLGGAALVRLMVWDDGVRWFVRCFVDIFSGMMVVVYCRSATISMVSSPPIIGAQSNRADRSVTTWGERSYWDGEGGGVSSSVVIPLILGAEGIGDGSSHCFCLRKHRRNGASTLTSRAGALARVRQMFCDSYLLLLLRNNISTPNAGLREVGRSRKEQLRDRPSEGA